MIGLGYYISWVIRMFCRIISWIRVANGRCCTIMYSSESGVLAAYRNEALDIIAIWYGFVLETRLTGSGLAEVTDLDRRSQVGR